LQVYKLAHLGSTNAEISNISCNVRNLRALRVRLVKFKDYLKREIYKSKRPCPWAGRPTEETATFAHLTLSQGLLLLRGLTGLLLVKPVKSCQTGSRSLRQQGSCDFNALWSY
jgi:hypothetical protein